jgi:TRAP-type C4-dicarboxylate transport system substrate-binding protein
MTFVIRYCSKCWEDLNDEFKKEMIKEAKKYKLYCIHEHDNLKQAIKKKRKKNNNTIDYLLIDNK